MMYWTSGGGGGPHRMGQTQGGETDDHETVCIFLPIFFSLVESVPLLFLVINIYNGYFNYKMG